MRNVNFKKNKYSNGHRYDYKYKAELINLGSFLKLENQLRRAIFFHEDVYDNHGTFLMDYQTAVDMNDMLSNNEEYIECRKINASYRQRRNRLRDRIEKIISTGNGYFITLTFNDKYLYELSDPIKRKYVAQYLKSSSDIYVANVDYGSEKGRIHFHACASLKEYPVEWIYGFSKFDPIINVQDDYKLACYISKLTNHAIKETTHRTSLIYSRNN